MTIATLQQTAELRRSVYALNKNLPVHAQDIVEMVRHIVKYTPSAFNSQSTRLVVLFDAEHEKLWQITEEILRDIVPAGNFAATGQKIAAFRAAAGTILFYEDTRVVEALQQQYAVYAENFPVWAEHANAMHQYAVWTTLTGAGIGANLQHYNPLIDEKTAETWDIPAAWQLRAQMVFGGIAAPAEEKSFQSVDERVKVFGL